MPENEPEPQAIDRNCPEWAMFAAAAAPIYDGYPSDIRIERCADFADQLLRERNRRTAQERGAVERGDGTACHPAAYAVGGGS
jgi:hypothetical protein